MMRMTFSKLTLLAFAVVFIGGAKAAENKLDHLPWERHALAHQEAEALSQAQCAERGGEWGKHGTAPQESCALKTADGGKICRNGNECEIACVSRVDPRYAKNRFVVAECVKSTSVLGCIFYVEGGMVAHADCRE